MTEKQKENKRKYAQELLEKFNKERELNCHLRDVEREDGYFHAEGNILGWEISSQGDTDTSDFYAVRATKNGICLEGDVVNLKRLSEYKEPSPELKLRKMKIEAEIEKLQIDLRLIEKEMKL